MTCFRIHCARKKNFIVGLANKFHLIKNRLKKCMCLEWKEELEKTKYYVTWPIRGPFKALKFSLLCIIRVLANYTDHVKFVLTCTHWI